MVDRRRVTVADGHQADRGGGVEVCLEERRRQRLHVGDVVEVRALLIERQPAAGVHVEPQQIVHRAGVFGAIEALEGANPGIRLRRGRRIDRRFERRDQRGVRRGVGTRRKRRRHHPRLQLANHLLRHVRVLRGAGDIERGE
jgi:hypothetical protein